MSAAARSDEAATASRSPRSSSRSLIRSLRAYSSFVNPSSSSASTQSWAPPGTTGSSVAIQRSAVG